MRDPYEVLGVSREASEAEIKAAFRRLAAIHHPDKNPGDPEAGTRFKEANLAHQILSDRDKRAAFDRYGEAAFRPGGGGKSGIDTSVTWQWLRRPSVRRSAGRVSASARVSAFGDIRKNLETQLRRSRARL